MPTLEERFSAALHNTARSWRQALDRRLRTLGVAQASWMAIAMVAKHAAPMSQTELADKLGVEDSTMVATIDRLVKAGYATREASPTDRRVKLVVLSEAGNAIYATVKKEADGFRTELLVSVSKTKIAAAVELLELLQAAAEAAE